MVDKKNRFQNIYFKKRLQQARNYKRPIRQVPQNQWQFFLNKIGLNSFFVKLTAIAILIFLTYLIYIPNFLDIRQITLEGVTLDLKQSILTTVSNYLSSKPVWPQSNLLLLSKKSLATYLTKNNQHVWRVKDIKKKFPSSLTIILNPRLNQFSFETKQTTFIVSNDGLVTKKNDPLATSTTPSNLITVHLSSENDFSVDQKIVGEDLLKKIVQIKSKLIKETQNNALYFGIENLENTDLTVYMPSGYKIFLDTNSDLEQVLKQYKLLWENLKNEQKQKLYYVDLRIKDKAYVCYKNTACARDISIIPPSNKTASSTVETFKK